MSESLYISDSNNVRIVQRNPATLAYISQLVSFPGVTYNSFTWLTFPYALAADSTYFYFTDVSNNNITKCLLADYSFVSQIGSFGSGNDQFNAPTDIVSDGTYLYVADAGNNRIVKRLATDLSYVNEIGTTGVGNDQFWDPEGITTDGTHLYVADTGNNRIVKRLASDLSYVTQTGTGPGTGNDEFSNPAKITVDGAYIYVSDENNFRIVKRLASDLSYVTKIGSGPGSGNDEFSLPLGVAADGTYLYVADSLNYRIVKRLLSDLSYVSHVGGPSFGYDNDTFSGVCGVAVAGSYLLVMDNGYARIEKRLLSDLSYVSDVQGLEIPTSGEFTFSGPEGIAQDSTYFYFIDNSALVKCVFAEDIANSVFTTNKILFNGAQLSASGPICCDGTYLYIARTQTILKFLASNLSYIGESVNPYNGVNSFASIKGLSTDGTNLFVTDQIATNNGRIVKLLNADFSFVSLVATTPTPSDNYYRSGSLYCSNYVVNI